MKAIILAGGRGSRLRPITDHIPKPLIALNNTPIIEWQIRYLKKFGIDEAIVCTGYKAEMIEHYIGRKKLGVRIRFSTEESPLGTGGAIKKAGKMIKDGSFFVLNGDVITDISLKKLGGKKNSIASVELRTDFGILETSGDRIKKFREKKPVTHVWMNAGVYHLQRDVLRDLPAKGDIEKTLFPDYAGTGRIDTVKFKNAKWLSIDSLNDIEKGSREVAKIIK